MNVQDTDYLIIGAGLAGTVLQRFLKSDRVVLLDPSPGAYKIGESIIPEHFHHPELRAMVPAIKALPSYSPKAGSTFISESAVASFPLPPHGADVAMHVSRHELEPLMHRLWDTPIRREKVVGIDLPSKVVTTDQGQYRVAKQILDCSGPAMVAARHLDGIDELWPCSARWAYFDVESVDEDGFWDAVGDAGLPWKRYDVPNGRLLDGPEDRHWRPHFSTLLTRIADGLWTWRIPLHNHGLVSLGLVSKNGSVSEQQLFDLAEAHPMPLYRLKRRPAGDGPYDRVHQRGRIARKAATAATLDVITISDACAFADPIYSVGTGLAVNKAIELAAILNEEGWNEATLARWTADYDRLIGRAVAAFGAWYDDTLMTDPATTREVQNNYLVGTAFQVGVAHHYSQVLVDAGAPADQPGPDGRGRHALDPAAPPLTDDVLGLLSLSSPLLMGWTLGGAYATASEVQMRWALAGRPELVINVSFDPDETRCFRRAGPLSLSFMNLWDGPYPMDTAGEVLFDALVRRMDTAIPDWLALADAQGLRATA